MKRPPNEFHCPSCGASVSPNAKSCVCGARRDGGTWLAPEASDGLDLDDDDFDYDDFVRREFGGASGQRWSWFARMSPKERFWWVVAVVVLAAFVAMAMAGWH